MKDQTQENGKKILSLGLMKLLILFKDFQINWNPNLKRMSVCKSPRSVVHITERVNYSWKGTHLDCRNELVLFGTLLFGSCSILIWRDGCFLTMLVDKQHKQCRYSCTLTNVTS